MGLAKAKENLKTGRATLYQDQLKRSQLRWPRLCQSWVNSRVCLIISDHPVSNNKIFGQKYLSKFDIHVIIH